ncbi:MAG: DinB family protein [Nocardioidaceae bacterium]
MTEPTNSPPEAAVETDMPEEFNWSMLSVPDPMAMVRGQLEFSWMVLRDRLVGLNDDEYGWEPAPGALSVRLRSDARTSRVLGTGDWVAEWPDGPDSRGPRTIAWLIAHLTEAFFERWEWTFGSRQRRRDDLDLPGERSEAVAELTRWVNAWRRGIAALPVAEVMTVGLSTASDIDAAAPFGHLVLHMNRELIHHGSEILVLQDLYAAQT